MKAKKKSNIGRRHIWIPDTQCRDEDDFSHLRAAGNYICDKQPDVIVHLGDHWDMPSLSSYDKGRKRSEGKRVHIDIAAGQRGMSVLLAPLHALQKRQKENKQKIYDPEMHFLIGNHEDRITRHVEANAELDGFLSVDTLCAEDYGWTVHGYKEIAEIDGIWFSHFFYNPHTGHPYGGMITTKLKNVGHSFVQGHRQGLDSGIKPMADGSTQRAVVAGSFYQHNEHYRGPQATNEWRGILFATEVQNGAFNLCEVSIKYLLDRWA